MCAESASLEASLSLAHLFNPQLAFLLCMHIPAASLGGLHFLFFQGHPDGLILI